MINPFDIFGINEQAQDTKLLKERVDGIETRVNDVNDKVINIRDVELSKQRDKMHSVSGVVHTHGGEIIGIKTTVAAIQQSQVAMQESQSQTQADVIKLSSDFKVESRITKLFHTGMAVLMTGGFGAIAWLLQKLLDKVPT